MLLIGICYHFVLFTNLVSEINILDQIGNSLVGHLCALLGLNISFMIGINLQVVCRAIKLRRLKKKQAAMIKKRNAERLLKLQQIKKALVDEEKMNELIQAEIEKAQLSPPPLVGRQSTFNFPSKTMKPIQAKQKQTTINQFTFT